MHGGIERLYTSTTAGETAAQSASVASEIAGAAEAERSRAIRDAATTDRPPPLLRRPTLTLPTAGLSLTSITAPNDKSVAYMHGKMLNSDIEALLTKVPSTRVFYVAPFFFA